MSPLTIRSKSDLSIDFDKGELTYDGKQYNLALFQIAMDTAGAKLFDFTNGDGELILDLTDEAKEYIKAMEN